MSEEDNLIIDTIPEEIKINEKKNIKKHNLYYSIKVFWYNNAGEVVTDINYWLFSKDIFKHINNRVGATEQSALLKIHNRVFNQNRKMSTCGSCVKELVDTMRKLFNEYEYEQETQAKEGS